MVVPSGGGSDGASILQNLLSGAPTTTATDPNALNVYMGATPRKTSSASTGDAIFKGGTNGGVDNILDQTSAENDFYTWSQPEQAMFTAKLYRAGIISDPSDFQSAVAYWKQAVDYAGNQYTNGQKKVTPWDVVQQSLGLAKAAGAGNGPKTTTQTNTSTATEVLTNGDANAMISSMYQNELGRDPTDGELSRYRSMLINKSKANPQVTKTTTTDHTDGKGNTSSSNSSTSSGGWSSTGLQNDLQGDVHADPEYGAYQAATQYMQAIEGLFSSPNLTSG